MSRDVFLDNLEKYLTDYERSEILGYDTLHFINILERKLPGGFEPPEGPANHGYDTEEGEYIYTKHDHVCYRFEIIKKLGQGSFGVVLRCFDHLKKEFVALKVIRNRKRLHKQG